MNRKIYFIILDGGADCPISALGNMTPFEYADTPTLDSLARKGCQSMISIIDADIAAESDSGCMALLSYNPLVYYKGRGPLEALGAGLMTSNRYCTAFRINFANYENGQLERRTARGLSNDELQSLTLSINKEVLLSDYYGTTFKLISYRRHRGILAFYNDVVPLSGNVSYTDPGFERNGYFGINVRDYVPIPKTCIPLDDSVAATHTAKIVNLFVERSHQVLDRHMINADRIQNGQLSANYLLVRDGGDLPVHMENFSSKFGLSLSIYGQLSAEKALAELVGASFSYSRQKEEEPNDLFFLNLIDEMVSDEANIIFVHMKGPDEHGHDNQPFKKVQAIESLDKKFLAPLISRIDASATVVVTCDHATPCEKMLHSSDRVPIVISSPNITADLTTKFGEAFAIHGGLPIRCATEVMDYLVSIL